MTAYVVAHVQDVTMSLGFIRYLKRVGTTLAPYDGRFLAQGGPAEELEGRWPGRTVVIEFPDRESARKWFYSAEYQELAELRRADSVSDIVAVDGV
ncbi:DUF1330 domain-containing protein [Streptomyces sp. NPDC002928]|uniref:DUF1330 domain-containing protein n=1 Tax=Streptomyces sp. NPDC002928 TaxID=3154440 RepID=UPI0033A6C1F2